MHQRPFRRVRAPLFLLLIPPALALTGGCPTVQAPSPLLDVQSDDHVLTVGSPRLTIIEYATLSACIAASLPVRPFPRSRPSTSIPGKCAGISHFPLNGHPRAKPAAEASECAAAQGRFWEYLELLFQNQPALADTDLESYAAQLGLDPTAFGECRSSGGQRRA